MVKTGIIATTNYIAPIITYIIYIYILIIAGVKFEITTMLFFTLFLWPLYNLNQDPSYSYYTN